MSTLEPDWKDKFLVLGIDIGTTHSGYAWAFRDEYDRDPRIIHAQTWKGEGKLTTGKTPTCLLLKPDKSFCKFGYEAIKKYSELVDEDMHRSWFYFERFKMTLYEEKGLSLSSTVLDFEGRKFMAVDIFAETIRYLKNSFLSGIQADAMKIPESDIFYVLTTPAIWSEKAKSFMRKAGEKAGISSDHLRIALEPECAAVYLRMLLTSPLTPYSKVQMPDMSLHVVQSPGLASQQASFNPGMTYLVVDMGGGTIDITLHRINSSGKLQELDTPSGGSWGSNNINQTFQSYIIGLVGAEVFEEFRQNNREDFIELLSDIEARKCSWDGESKSNLKIPTSLLELHKEELSQSVKQCPKSFRATVQRDKIKMGAETFESFFTDTVNSTIRHVKDIISKLDKRVDMILLVGGFADCKLMRKKFEETFGDKVDTIIYPVADADLAVLKGSVLYGRDPSIIDTRISRYTYGLDWNEEFDHRHPAEKKEHTDDGTYCKDIFRKLIQKGDRVDSSEIIEAYPRYKFQEKIEFPFYRSESNLTPKFVDDEGCFHLGTLSVELPPEDRNLDSCIKLKVMFGLTELTAEATDSKGRKCSSRFNLLQTQI